MSKIWLGGVKALPGIGRSQANAPPKTTKQQKDFTHEHDKKHKTKRKSEQERGGLGVGTVKLRADPCGRTAARPRKDPMEKKS